VFGVREPKMKGEKIIGRGLISDMIQSVLKDLFFQWGFLKPESFPGEGGKTLERKKGAANSNLRWISVRAIV